jgi:hypothetical protein
MFGQDTGVLKLDVVTQLYAVLGHCSFVRMRQPNALVVLLNPGLNCPTKTLPHLQGML